MGSGYTRCGEKLPGDRGFFGNGAVRSLLQTGKYPALDYMLEPFRQLSGENLESVGLEEVWTFLDFAGKELFRGSLDLKGDCERWLDAIRKQETQLDDEHCLCQNYRTDKTIPTPADIDLLLVAGWDLRRLLSRVFDELTPPEINPYEALLTKYRIPKDDITTIVSLNYDTVLENALHQSGTQWHYRHVPTTVPREPRSIRILKPHGSLNWRFRGNEPPVEIDTDYRLAPVACRCERENRFEEAMIIPPTQIKQAITVAETQKPETVKLFSTIWQDIVTALTSASRVFVIGYSFPPTDLHLRTCFLLANRQGKFKPYDEVYCCTKADGQEGLVFANANRFFPATNLHAHDRGFEDFVSQKSGQ